MLCLKHQQENKNVDEKVRKQRKFNVVFLFAQIMQHLYPQYSWIAILIEMFITISITVSYLTVGAALHHTRESQCPSRSPTSQWGLLSTTHVSLTSGWRRADAQQGF